jgi:hypothetical protein
MKKTETITRIKTARQRVRHEVEDLTERLRVTQENIKRIRQRVIERSLTNENSKYEMSD